MFVRIEFDAEKDVGNRAKHGCSLADAVHLDWGSVTAKLDVRRDYGKSREIGYGLWRSRLYCVIFVRRGYVFRIISLRKANAREVRRYVREN